MFIESPEEGRIKSRRINFWAGIWISEVTHSFIAKEGFEVGLESQLGLGWWAGAKEGFELNLESQLGLGWWAGWVDLIWESRKRCREEWDHGHTPWEEARMIKQWLGGLYSTKPQALNEDSWLDVIKRGQYFWFLSKVWRKGGSPSDLR